eukprot:596833-Amphidinium_carterae.1
MPWKVLSMIGTRRVAFLVRVCPACRASVVRRRHVMPPQAVFPQYADTVFYFPKLGALQSAYSFATCALKRESERLARQFKLGGIDD